MTCRDCKTVGPNGHTDVAAFYPSSWRVELCPKHAMLEEIAEALPPADRLRTLAAWFDAEQDAGRWPHGSREVQANLRAWATKIEETIARYRAVEEKQ